MIILEGVTTKKIRRDELTQTHQTGIHNSDKFHFYGEELMKRSMAYRSFIDAGIVAAAGSDFPPGPIAPLMAFRGWSRVPAGTVNSGVRTSVSASTRHFGSTQ